MFVDTALEQFRTMLAADGYTLNWSESSSNKIVVRVEAGEGACSDCLVPSAVMEAMLSEALTATAYELDHVELPTAS